MLSESVYKVFLCMTLDSMVSGAQRHIQGFLDQDTRSLATILCLPLVDGVFATMLVSNSLSNVSQALSVALTIFAGAGSLAVVFSMQGSRKEVKRKVLKASALLVLGSAVVAVVAPVYGQLVSLSVMREVAAIALVVIAGKMLDLPGAGKIPVSVVVLTGFLISLKQPSELVFSLEYLLPALSTALTASALLILGTYLNTDLIDLSVMRKGAAMVILLIAVSMTGLSLPSGLTSLALSLTLLFSLDISLPGEVLRKRLFGGFS